MVDYHMWPWFERLPALTEITGGVELVSASSFPRLAAWMQAMWQTKPVKKTMMTTQLHVEFLTSYSTGEPAYDAGLVQVKH